MDAGGDVLPLPAVHRVVTVDKVVPTPDTARIGEIVLFAVRNSGPLLLAGRQQVHAAVGDVGVGDSAACGGFHLILSGDLFCGGALRSKPCGRVERGAQSRSVVVPAFARVEGMGEGGGWGGGADSAANRSGRGGGRGREQRRGWRGATSALASAVLPSPPASTDDDHHAVTVAAAAQARLVLFCDEFFLGSRRLIFQPDFSIGG